MSGPAQSPTATPPLRSLLLFGARVAFWCGAAALAYALCRRGITLGDEGYLLSQARDIVAGKVPYRDLDMFVTPGVWYLIAGIFSLFGPSVIATRIAAALCLLATMAVTRRIVRASGSALWGDFAAGLVAVFAVWAYPAWTFSFYSPWAVLISMSALACTLEWMRSRRAAWMLCCGALLGLAIAFKQNYGVFAAVGCALGVLLDEIATAPAPLANAWRDVARRFLRTACVAVAGMALVLLPAVAWLAYQGALGAAFDSLLLRPFQGFVDAHSIRYLRIGDLWRRLQMWSWGGYVYMAVPVAQTQVVYRWPAAAISLVETLHVLLYWIPVFAFAGLGLRGLMRLRVATPPERALLAVTVFAAVFFLGVFPRADFNHLINVYQPVLAMSASAAALHFGAGRWRTRRLRRGAAGACALVFLCYAGVAALWMNDLRKTLWIPLEAPRAGVLLEPLMAQMLDYEIDLLRSMVPPDEPMFALPGLSMIPFLAERDMPTRYYNYYSVHIGHDAGREAAREIEESAARVVLADYNNFFADPVPLTRYGSELAEYLDRNFRPTLSVAGYNRMILQRRDEALEDVPRRGLWQYCRIPMGGRPSQMVREHLLFRTLYHSYRGVVTDDASVVTVCRLRVPSHARVRFSLDLRQPVAAEERVIALADVWTLPERGRPRRLLRRRWSLTTESSWSMPAGREYALDLSAYEGKTLTLLFRSQIDGKPPDTLDPFGLSVMWNDAYVESPEFAPDEDDDAAPEPDAGVQSK